MQEARVAALEQELASAYGQAKERDVEDDETAAELAAAKVEVTALAVVRDDALADVAALEQRAAQAETSKVRFISFVSFVNYCSPPLLRSFFICSHAFCFLRYLCSGGTAQAETAAELVVAIRALAERTAERDAAKVEVAEVETHAGRAAETVRAAGQVERADAEVALSAAQAQLAALEGAVESAAEEGAARAAAQDEGAAVRAEELEAAIVAAQAAAAEATTRADAAVHQVHCDVQTTTTVSLTYANPSHTDSLTRSPNNGTTVHQVNQHEVFYYRYILNEFC